MHYHYSSPNDTLNNFFLAVREGTFLIEGGGGGWAGASEGRVISKYFTNWGGSNLFYTQLREGRSIFCKETLLHVG